MIVGGHHRRAVAVAVQVSFASGMFIVVLKSVRDSYCTRIAGGYISAFSFLAKDAPRYIPGYSVAVAFVALSLISSTIYYIGISWDNRKRDRAQANGTCAQLSEEEKRYMGDLSPDYRYFT